jgi:hypothetical protein
MATPLFDGGDGLAAFVRCWLLHVPGGDFGLTARQKEPGGFRQVLTHMKTIGHLNGIGSGFGSG